MMDYNDMHEAVMCRMERILTEIPPEAITEKYEASALRDYAQTLIYLERLQKGQVTQWQE